MVRKRGGCPKRSVDDRRAYQPPKPLSAFLPTWTWQGEKSQEREWKVLLHYGGNFCFTDGENKPCGHENYSVKDVGVVERDRISMFELQWLITKVDMPKSSMLFYQHPSRMHDFKDGLRQLKTDEDVFVMLDLYYNIDSICIIVLPPDGKCDWIVAPDLVDGNVHHQLNDDGRQILQPSKPSRNGVSVEQTAEGGGLATEDEEFFLDLTTSGVPVSSEEPNIIEVANPVLPSAKDKRDKGKSPMLDEDSDSCVVKEKDPRDFSDTDEEINESIEDDTVGASHSMSEEENDDSLPADNVGLVQESPIPSEDDLCKSSSDEEKFENVVKNKMKSILRTGPWKSPVEFSLDMKFESNRAAREYIRQYAAEQWYAIVVTKNESNRVTAHCADGCKWKFHASSVQGSQQLYIKVLNNEHTCQWKDKNPNVSAEFLAKAFEDDFRHDPKWAVSTLEMNAKRKYGIALGRSNKYRVRELALKSIHGDLEDQYNLLYGYAEQVRIDNPGSTVKIVSCETTEPNVRMFERIYICLEGCRKGFTESCRPYIGVDACHLRHVHGGILMTAVAVDGNDGIFPIAWAVVEGETRDSWEWFISLLLGDINREGQKDWVFMSDRQKGLVPALNAFVPATNIRFCLRHIYANFKLQFRGVMLKDCLERAAKATHVNQHNQQMEKMKDLNLKAYEYMTSLQKESWARYAFSTHVKCDRLLNNLSECFNAWKPVAKARDEPIFQLLEGIRRAVMRRFEENRSNKKLVGLKLCPRIYSRIEMLKREGRYCIAHYAGSCMFEVQDKDEYFRVNLNDGSCTCNKWALSGLPCRHAIPAIQHMNGNIEDFVHPYFHVDTYLKAYAPMIYPVLGPSSWTHTGHPKLVPPKAVNAPGRPVKKRIRTQQRIRDPDEPKRTIQVSVRCSKCHEKGHNITTCKGQKSTERQGPGKSKKRKVAASKNPATPATQASQTNPSSASSSKPKATSGTKVVKSMGFLVEDDRPRSITTGKTTKHRITGYGLIQDGNEQRVGYARSETGPQPLVPPPQPVHVPRKMTTRSVYSSRRMTTRSGLSLPPPPTSK